MQTKGRRDGVEQLTEMVVYLTASSLLIDSDETDVKCNSSGKMRAEVPKAERQGAEAVGEDDAGF